MAFKNYLVSLVFILGFICSALAADPGDKAAIRGVCKSAIADEGIATAIANPDEVDSEVVIANYEKAGVCVTLPLPATVVLVKKIKTVTGPKGSYEVWQARNAGGNLWYMLIKVNNEPS